MNSVRRTAAVRAAKRFEAAVVVLERAQERPGCGTLPKENGALRRASMDLTRALAEMRKPG